MLKIIATTLLIFTVACVPAMAAETSSKMTAVDLAASLDKVNHVSFYFLSRTGNYSIRGDRFKTESTTRIYRSCGSNCRRFMREVVSHLEQARLAKCQPGQQNVLIEVGDATTVLYSYSGRMIEFKGKCYFNGKGIDGVIKSAKFLFS